MATEETESIPALLRSVLADARELVREELALAQAEIRGELLKARGAAISFVAAAVVALVAVTLLCAAIAGGLAALVGIPSWVAFGVMAVFLAIGAYVAANRGRTQLSTVRPLPITKASVEENLAWMQNKSSSR